jgi:hypothetical protein
VLVTHACELRAEIRRIAVRGQSRQIVPKIHLQNNHSKMDRRCGLTKPWFKLQCQQNNNNNDNDNNKLVKFDLKSVNKRISNKKESAVCDVNNKQGRIQGGWHWRSLTMTRVTSRVMPLTTMGIQKPNSSTKIREANPQAIQGEKLGNFNSLLLG